MAPAIVQADNKFFIDLQCKEEDGTARDLTGATLTAAMRINGGTVFNPSVAALGDAVDGVARVTLLATHIPADTTNVYGPFELQITATWPDGTVKSSSVFRDRIQQKIR